MNEPPPHQAPAERVFPIVAFALPFLAYLWSLPQGSHWLDSPEFAAGAVELGVVHPPGHPLYLMLARGATLLLPLGSVPFRLNLLSALLGACAAWLLYRVSARFSQTLYPTPPSWASRAPALLAALAFGLAFSTWTQGQRAEVYTLNICLLLLVIDRLSLANTRDALLAGLVFGLALGNHHYLMFLSLPALLILLLPDRSWTARLGFGLATGLGLLIYGYLVMRAPKPLLLNWARPGDLAALWETLSAKVFQAAVGSRTGSTEAIDPIANLIHLTGMLARDLSAGLLLVPLGVIFAARRSRRAALFLGVLLASSLVAKGLMEVDPMNPDEHGYLLPSLAAACIAAGVALAGLSWILKRRAWVPSLLTTLGLVALTAVRAPELDISNFDATDRVYDALVEDIPPGGALFAWYYPVHFLALSKRIAEGARPDLAVLHQSLDFKIHRGLHYAQDMKLRQAWLGPLLDDFIATGQWRLAAAHETQATRGLTLTPSPEPVLPVEALQTRGLGFALRDASTPVSSPAATALSLASSAESFDALSASIAPWLPRDRSTRRVLVHLRYAAASLLKRQGHEAAANKHLEAVRDLLGGRGSLDLLP